MKISDEIYAAINKFRRENVWFAPSIKVGEYSEIRKNPTRIYIGHETMREVLNDPDFRNFYEINHGDNKRDKMFGLEVYEVCEDEHIFVA